MKINDKYWVYKPLVIIGISSALLALIVSFILTPSLRNLLTEEKKHYLQNVAKIAVGTFDTYYHKYEIGELDQENAKSQALSNIKDMRFGNGNYFFIFNDDISIMNPAQPEREGRSLDYFVGGNGEFYLIDAANLCKVSGSGFVTYSKIKPGETVFSTKLAYVTSYPKWNFYIGVGVFVDEINDSVNSIVIRANLLILALAFISGLFYLIIIKFNKNSDR